MNRDEFETKVHRFSHASVYGKHYDPFRDIDWDDPEYAITPDDERWILGPQDNLGAHPWYQSLPREEQIRVGMWRVAHTMKVGSQFELELISGIMHRAVGLENNAGEEFRYPMHEASEEINHIQMFQKLVDRTGVNTKGAPAWFRHFSPYITPYANMFPVALWTFALAGEEPVDHVQKSLLREAELHPLVRRIMHIHVSEEARHINFAHTYLRRAVPKLNRVEKLVFSVLYPTVMRSISQIIMCPSRAALKEAGIPKKVADEIWWNSDSGRDYLSNLFPNARELADELGLRGPLGRAAWRLMGIDERKAPPSDTEPVPAHY